MQRRSDALWLAVIVFLTSISIGNADVLVSESFDYDPGPLDGQDGGDGWGDIWLMSETLFDTDFRLDVFEPETPLVYAFPEGGFANGGDRALIFSNDDPEAVLANETMALTRDLDLAIDLDEVYFSFLYRYEGDGTETGGFIDDNDFVVWWFNSAGKANEIRSYSVDDTGMSSTVTYSYDNPENENELPIKISIWRKP